jgi:hypothetical protein
MWPIQLAFRLLISCMIFLCSLTLSNTSSFLTWSVQLIFSILLQHHISKLSRCFWSIFIYINHKLWYMLLGTQFVFLSRIHRVLGGAYRSYIQYITVSLWRWISIVS